MSDREVAEFKRYMEQKGVNLSRFVVICTPFTRVEGKAWDIAKMKEVLVRVIRRYDAQLIFNYSREEKAAALALYEEMDFRYQGITPSDVFPKEEIEDKMGKSCLTSFPWSMCGYVYNL